MYNKEICQELKLIRQDEQQDSTWYSWRYWYISWEKK